MRYFTLTKQRFFILFHFFGVSLYTPFSVSFIVLDIPKAQLLCASQLIFVRSHRFLFIFAVPSNRFVIFFRSTRPLSFVRDPMTLFFSSYFILFLNRLSSALFFTFFCYVYIFIFFIRSYSTLPSSSSS